MAQCELWSEEYHSWLHFKVINLLIKYLYAYILDFSSRALAHHVHLWCNPVQKQRRIEIKFIKLTKNTGIKCMLNKIRWMWSLHCCKNVREIFRFYFNAEKKNLKTFYSLIPVFMPLHLLVIRSNSFHWDNGLSVTSLNRLSWRSTLHPFTESPAIILNWVTDVNSGTAVSIFRPNKQIIQTSWAPT